MELGVYAKKGFRSFVVVFVLVVVIEANIFTSWYHGPNEDTIKTYLAREILGKTMKDGWRQWKKDGVFTESSANNIKEITFSPTAREPLGKILGYLNYFPLIEKGSVIYNIPVDGQNVKIKLERTGTTFRAEHLYTNGPGPQQQTRLSNSKKIMQELIANTKDHPNLRKALESTMPKILRKDIRKKGTFDEELRKATGGSSSTIPDDVKNKAFRNAIEAMLSTTVLRKSPETWIAKANSKVKDQTSNLKISMESTVKEQWKEWHKKGIFTETTDPSTKLKTVKFKNDGLSISPNEIFHTLQYFPHLESGPVCYNIPIDGVPFVLELAPKTPPSSEFSVKRVYRDKHNMEKKKDISNFSSLRRVIDHYVLYAKHGELRIVLSTKFRRIFKFPDKDNPKNVFKEAVKEETQHAKTHIPTDVQDRVFKNSVDLVAASIMLKKDIPKVYWMHDIYERIKSDVKIEEDILKKKAIN